MPKMMTRGGAFKEVPTHDLPIKDTTMVLPNNHMQNTDIDHAELAHVKDTQAFKTSINPIRYGEENAMLLGFPEGTPISVTYFHRNEPGINVRTIQGDVDIGEHPTHADLTQINSFEMRLISPIEHRTYDDNDEFALDFTVVTYPGFTPTEGDVFFMNLGDGRYGECRVVEVERTTYRHGTYHRLYCGVIRQLTTEVLLFYKTRVFDTVHFDKTTYFNSNFSFMRHESFVSLERLQKKRRELVQWYFNKFYNNDARSLIRQDGIYDPYVVKFITRLVSMLDSKKRAVQLYPRVPNYDKSIWYMLTESEYLDFPSMLATYHTDINKKSLFATELNYILNRSVVFLGNGVVRVVDKNCPFAWSDVINGQPYVFSSQFYEQGVGMTMLEETVYRIKFDGTIDPVNILTIVDNYKNLDPYLSFYHIPMYIWLIDMGIRSLTKGS